MPETDLIGTWQLVSVTAQQPDGKTTEPYGHHPRGLVVYGSDGRVVAVIAHENLDRFQSDSIAAASSAEASYAFRRTLGYSGRYEVDTDAGTVVHHVDACTFPNWQGEDEVRHFETDGDRLTMKTPPIQSGSAGEEAVFTLVFERG